MRNEVLKLTKGDLSNIKKEYQIVAQYYLAGEAVLETFNTEYEAKNYLEKLNTSQGYDRFCNIDIRAIRFEG